MQTSFRYYFLRKSCFYHYLTILLTWVPDFTHVGARFKSKETREVAHSCRYSGGYLTNPKFSHIIIPMTELGIYITSISAGVGDLPCFPTFSMIPNPLLSPIYFQKRGV